MPDTISLNTGSSVGFVYDSAQNVTDINNDTAYSACNPGSIIFQNISGTATVNENCSNIYKGIYIVDQENNEKSLKTIFSNRLNNYSCSTKSGADLDIKDNDSIQEAIGKLHKAILDLEYVMAAAINDINARLNKLNI